MEQEKTYDGNAYAIRETTGKMTIRTAYVLVRSHQTHIYTSYFRQCISGSANAGKGGHFQKRSDEHYIHTQLNYGRTNNMMVYEKFSNHAVWQHMPEIL